MPTPEIFDYNLPPEKAAASFFKNKFVVIEGTKTSAISYIEKVIQIIKVNENFSPIASYMNVPNNGYFYFILDTQIFTLNDERIKRALFRLDEKFPP